MRSRRTPKNPSVSFIYLSTLVLVVCGNKNDQYELEEIPEREAKAYAQEIGAIFKTTSAKTYSGIEEMFKLIAKKVLHPDYLDTSNLTKEQQQELAKQKKLALNKANAKNTKKGCC